MGRNKFSTSTALALAAVLLSSSTAVYAVASLPKHSVGKKQLKTSAVTTKKIAKHAVTASKIAPATVVSAQRMAFGKGNGTSTGATVLTLSRLGVTVKTNGAVNQVAVNLPRLASYYWFVNSSDDPTQMYSVNGIAPLVLGPAGASREVTAHIWRADTSAGIYLHCVFDTTGFSGVGPLSCWAMST